MAELQIGSLKFRSKKEAGEWFGEILRSNPAGAQCKPHGMQDMVELIKRHPNADEKIGCGIERFEIRENPVFKNQKSFYLVRKDGTETDFSFRVCVSGKSGSVWSRFCSAARHAIRDQIIVFKTSQFLGVDEVKCSITGEIVEWNSCHVDHVITFDEILRKFVSEKQIEVCEQLLSKSSDGDILDSIASDELKQDWQSFHKNNAVLRITTVDANLKRNRQ